MRPYEYRCFAVKVKSDLPVILPHVHLEDRCRSVFAQDHLHVRSRIDREGLSSPSILWAEATVDWSTRWLVWRR